MLIVAEKPPEKIISDIFNPVVFQDMDDGRVRCSIPDLYRARHHLTVQENVEHHWNKTKHYQPNALQESDSFWYYVMSTAAASTMKSADSLSIRLLHEYNSRLLTRLRRSAELTPLSVTGKTPRECALRILDCIKTGDIKFKRPEYENSEVDPNSTYYMIYRTDGLHTHKDNGQLIHFSEVYAQDKKVVVGEFDDIKEHCHFISTNLLNRLENI